jgi:2-keto-4-pentenoate hydratase
MNAFDADALASFLLARRAEGKVTDALPAGLAPGSLDEGYAAQFAMARRLGAVPPAGFKIGATGGQMQAYLGVDAPVAGFMQADDIHRGTATLPFSRLLNPGVECELVVRLAADLPPGPCDLDRAISAVGELVCGIEVVENRYPDFRALGVPALAADRMFHAAAVIGEQGGVAWRDLDLVAIAGSLSVGGRVVSSGVGGDLLGHPIAGLAWLAASPLAARFGGLRQGQWIMLGSVTPPCWLDRPCQVEVAFPPLPSATITLV